MICNKATNATLNSAHALCISLAIGARRRPGPLQSTGKKNPPCEKRSADCRFQNTICQFAMMTPTAYYAPQDSYVAVWLLSRRGSHVVSYEEDLSGRLLGSQIATAVATHRKNSLPRACSNSLLKFNLPCLPKVQEIRNLDREWIVYSCVLMSLHRPSFWVPCMEKKQVVAQGMEGNVPNGPRNSHDPKLRSSCCIALFIQRGYVSNS